MEILKAIIKGNIKHTKGETFISFSLLDLLVEDTNFEESILKIPKCSIANAQFAKVSDIPNDLYHYLNFETYIELAPNQAKPLDKIEHTISYTGRKFWLEDLKAAFENYDKYKCEFIDAFTDESTIAENARLLSVLVMLSPKLDNNIYLHLAFNSLRRWDKNFVLVSCSFKKYYQRLMWHKRVGLSRGCILNQISTL